MIDMIYNLRVGDIHAAEFSDEFSIEFTFYFRTGCKIKKMSILTIRFHDICTKVQILRIIYVIY